MKRLIVLFMVLTGMSLYGQQQQDTFTSVNYSINRITTTLYGWIIHYSVGSTEKELYLPTHFFSRGVVVRVNADDTIAPQMNVILKNLEPFKLRLYIPVDVENRPYIRSLTVTSQEMIDKFNVTRLIID